MDTPQALLILGWLALHLLGLVVAWATRIAAGCRLENAVQLAFYLTLLAISVTAWLSHMHELGLWLPSGLALILMVVTAVADGSPTMSTVATPETSIAPVARRA